MKQKYNVLRDAYAIIDGIPDDKINLGSRRHGWNNEDILHDQVSSCPSVWLSLNPKMNNEGLHRDYDVETDVYEIRFLGYTELRALAHFFFMGFDDVIAIFDNTGFDRRFDPPNVYALTDKQVWKARVINFLKSKGEPISPEVEK